MNLTQILIYSGSGVLLGFVAAWIIRTISIAKLKRIHQDATGFLEREKLGKERLQRETQLLYQREQEWMQKLEAAERLYKQMDSDILLLQKSNEETESLLQISQPELHSLKVRLIEATNTIARMKAGKASSEV